jgi:uncharacterized protein
MNPPALFEACVPVLVRYLGSLDRILLAVQALGSDQADRVLRSRLVPNMLTCSQQIETAAYFALRTAYRLAGRPVPAFLASNPTPSGLRNTIAATLTLVQSLHPEEFVGAEARTVQETAGAAPVELAAAMFLHEFALPNFFFHLNMAYAIARAQGCALGKPAYDGFHVYDSGA